MVGFNVNYYYDNTNSYKEVPYMKDNIHYLKPAKMELYKISDIVWYKVYKVGSIRKYNVIFKENFLYEDTDFTIKYILLAKPIYQFLNITGYGFRQRNSSVSHTEYSDVEQIKSLYSIYSDLDEMGKVAEYNEYFLGFIMKAYKDIESGIIINCKELEYLASKIFKNLQEDEIALDIFCPFINNEEVKKCYERSILKYKPYKYKLVTPNIIIYKIKREINRVIKKFLKNIKR